MADTVFTHELRVYWLDGTDSTWKFNSEPTRSQGKNGAVTYAVEGYDVEILPNTARAIALRVLDE